jgi:hypothetical protein
MKPIALLVLAIFLLPHPISCHGEKKEKLFRGLPSQQLETVLKDMKISYKKGRGDKAGIFLYDFEHNKSKIRLVNYNSNDLWIDAIFPKLELEEINRWNRKAKFCRAVLFKDGEEESTSLENQLDCKGGVSLGMVRQFIRRFEQDVEAFGKFVPKK